MQIKEAWFYDDDGFLSDSTLVQGNSKNPTELLLPARKTAI